MRATQSQWVVFQAMVNEIPNDELTIESLPDASDAQKVFAFAMSFDGYTHFGSVSASAASARKKPRQTLSELRNELFVVARSSRHVGSDTYVNLYIELLPFLHEALRQRKSVR
jgi:hypothetical protein